MGIPEVGLRDGLEALLAGGVPQLQLDYVAVYFHLLYFEVDSDRAVLLWVEIVFCKPEKHRSFTAARISQHYYLIQSSYFVRLYFLWIEFDSLAEESVSL